MKRRFRAAIPAAFLAFLLAAAPAHPEALRFDPLADGILLGGSMAAAAVSELLPRLAPPASPPAPQAGDVNAFDGAFLVPYAQPLDYASTATEFTALALPVLALFLGDVEDGMGAILVAAEAYALADGAKNLAKHLLPRWRPYLYTGGAAGIDAEEDAVSFPSGHTTMAFAAAAVNTYLFAELLPDSPWFLPWAGLNYALAAATGALRVASGMHFVTDVVAGALLGSACGYGIPLLRAALLRGGGRKVSFAASADGVRLLLRL